MYLGLQKRVWQYILSFLERFGSLPEDSSLLPFLIGAGYPCLNCAFSANARSLLLLACLLQPCRVGQKEGIHSLLIVLTAKVYEFNQLVVFLKQDRQAGIRKHTEIELKKVLQCCQCNPCTAANSRKQKKGCLPHPPQILQTCFLHHV